MEKSAFKFSDEGAINYDKYLGPLLFEPYALGLVSGIGTANVQTVLEIACGTGRVTRHLRKHFEPAVELVASDISPDMLKIAQNKLDGQPVEFRVEDAQVLSFPDDSFDLVVCQFGLMFLPDKKKGLSEAMRVLKPGGTFIFSTWDRTENIPLLKLVFNDMLLPYFKDQPASRFLVPFSLFDPSLLATWMKEVGFIDVKTDRVVLSSMSPTPEEIINGFFVKHSIGREVYVKDPVEFDNMAKKMHEAIVVQFGSTEITFELAAFLVSGKK